jgi:signal transduction histidine kinase
MSTTARQHRKTENSSPGLQLILRPKNLIPGLLPEYVLDHFPATIGRHPSNDMELPFDAISRYHARIELENGLPRLVDLKSSNGSFVNGKRVQIAPVEDQDTLAFGSLEFSLVTHDQMASRIEPAATERATTSVHFIQNEDPLQTIYHTELPEDSSHASIVTDEEITNEAQLKKAKQRLITLYRLQDVLRSNTDEEKLLRRVLNLIFEVLPVDRGVILTRDGADPSTFRPIVIKTKAPNAHEKIGISRTILQRCLREKVAILTRDATRDSRFDGSDSILASSMRSVMCVPLVSVRHVFGFLHLDTTDAVRSFGEEDLTFVANVAGEVATHLHNLRMLNEKILSERMAAIGQTITGMAHNIKNILVLTQGGIDMMEKRLHRKNYDTVEETWAVVRRGLDRINKLTQDMLDYSRARTVEKRRTNVNDLLEDLNETFHEEFEQRHLTCTVEADEKVPAIPLDTDGLEKALTNLIVNATEAAQPGGHIILRTRMDEENDIVIEVTDDAGGIPAEILPRIFIPFFTTKGSKGSGLGLAMTRKFIEDMGGRIEVRSIEGEGTTFIISIPVTATTPRLSGDGTSTGSSSLGLQRPDAGVL